MAAPRLRVEIGEPARGHLVDAAMPTPSLARPMTTPTGSTLDAGRAANIEEANRASNSRQWPEAAKLWDALRTDLPGNPLCWSKAGEAYREQGLLDRADELLKEAGELFPNDFWISYQYAIVAQRREDWAEALLRAEGFRRRFPDVAIGHLLRGEALLRLGRLDDAISVFSDAAQRFPRDEWVLYWFAQVAGERGNWSEALDRWDAMLARFPGHTTAMIRRAEVLSELGRLREAKAAIADALVAEPSNDRALAIRAALESKLNPHGSVVRQIREGGFERLLPERVADPEVLIEITSICNFACTYCVSPMKLREKKHMSMDLFRDVIRQVAAITTKPVRLHVDGEPTAHPNFKEMALLVNRHGLPVWLATNGSRLDSEFLEIWMDLLISMSSSPEELAKRHSKLDFGTYIERIAGYVNAWSRSGARQHVELQILYYPQQDESEEAEYRKHKDTFLTEFCRAAGLYETCTEESAIEDDVYRFSRRAHPGQLSFVKWPVSGGGLYPVNGKLLPRERATAGFCDAPWRQLAIHSDGSLGACCVDLSGGTTFASPDDPSGQSIKQLWESGAQITKMRQRFLEGHIERDVCQRCLAQGQVSFAADSR